MIITTYSSAFKIHTATIKYKFNFDMKINDECFPFNTGIHTNEGIIQIGELYNKFYRNEKLPLILSFNEINKQFEYKKMSYAWQKENSKLLKIEMNNKYIKCTHNHKILTTRGYIEACKLTQNDMIISKYDKNNNNTIIIPFVNSDQLQIIYGSLLSDGVLVHVSNNRFKLEIFHGHRQKEYCKWKAKMII